MEAPYPATGNPAPQSLLPDEPARTPGPRVERQVTAMPPGDDHVRRWRPTREISPRRRDAPRSSSGEVTDAEVGTGARLRRHVPAVRRVLDALEIGRPPPTVEPLQRRPGHAEPNEVSRTDAPGQDAGRVARIPAGEERRAAGAVEITVHRSRRGHDPERGITQRPAVRRHEENRAPAGEREICAVPRSGLRSRDRPGSAGGSDGRRQQESPDRRPHVSHLPDRPGRRPCGSLATGSNPGGGEGSSFAG